MTEISKINDDQIRQRLQRKRYVIDPVAFFKALFLAPLIVAAAGFWVLFIPVFAVVFGGPVYLLVGTPVLLTYLHFAHGHPMDIAFVALGTMVLILLAGAPLAPLLEIEKIMELALFGLIFAPVWGGVFGLLYNRWRNPASRQPLPPLV